MMMISDDQATRQLARLHRDNSARLMVIGIIYGTQIIPRESDPEAWASEILNLRDQHMDANGILETGFDQLIWSILKPEHTEARAQAVRQINALRELFWEVRLKKAEARLKKYS